jgi:hypothetical protein
MTTLSLKIPKTLEAKLNSTARRRRTTKSIVVREALEDYLSRDGQPSPSSFAALAKEFIGCVKGGPPDLATNKKHMKGFGR